MPWTEGCESFIVLPLHVYVCTYVLFVLDQEPSSNFLSSRSSHSLTSSSGSLFRLQWPRRTFYAKWIKMIVVSDKWAYRQIFPVLQKHTSPSSHLFFSFLPSQHLKKNRHLPFFNLITFLICFQFSSFFFFAFKKIFS